MSGAMKSTNSPPEKHVFMPHLPPMTLEEADAAGYCPTWYYENKARERDDRLGLLMSPAEKRKQDADRRIVEGFPGAGIAGIVLDHTKRRAGLRAAGRVHWCPPAFYEPLARLAQKYDAMDQAMRNWEAILREAEIAARDA